MVHITLHGCRGQYGDIGGGAGCGGGVGGRSDAGPGAVATGVVLLLLALE